MEVPGGVIEVTIGPTEPSVPESALLRWVASSARAVSAYYGRFPVPRLRLNIVTGWRGRVGYGTTWCQDAPSIRISVGRATAEADLAEDWILTHEMVHLGFPDMPRAHHWIEEGLATYVEPVARARIGTLTEERVWRDLADGLPKGLPGPDDAGLDGTRSWGPTYWGGALFWLTADVGIRERTRNRRGVEDALSGILAAGGDACAHWDVERALEAGDRATGVPVLRELYARMGSSPSRVDLEALWRRLGVVRRGEELLFDERAPLSAVRRSITRPREAPGP